MSITGIPNIEIIWGRSNHRFDCAMRITILNALGLRDLNLSVSLLKYIVSIDFLTKYFENLMLTNLTYSLELRTFPRGVEKGEGNKNLCKSSLII